MVETVAWAAGNGDRSENGDYIYGKQRLREIDGRIHFLTQTAGNRRSGRSGAAEKPRAGLFGATVTYRTQHGEDKMVRIVGIDEARSELHEISWIAPVGKALLKAAEGDVVEVRTPHGLERIEVLNITY